MRACGEQKSSAGSSVLSAILLPRTGTLAFAQDSTLVDKLLAEWLENGGSPRVFWILVLFVLIGITLLLNRWHRRERNEIASGFGLTPVDGTEVDRRFSGFELLSKPNSKVILASSGCSDGTPFVLFEIRSGRGENESEVTCVGVECSEFGFPRLSIQPAGALQRFNRFLQRPVLGADDRPKAVELSASESFTAAYNVYASDADASRVAVSGTVQALLKDSDRIAVECAGTRFLSYRPGRQQRKGQVQGFVEVSLRLCHHLAESTSN